MRRQVSPGRGKWVKAEASESRKRQVIQDRDKWVKAEEVCLPKSTHNILLEWKILDHFEKIKTFHVLHVGQTLSLGKKNMKRLKTF